MLPSPLSPYPEICDRPANYNKCGLLHFACDSTLLWTLVKLIIEHIRKISAGERHVTMDLRENICSKCVMGVVLFQEKLIGWPL